MRQGKEMDTKFVILMVISALFVTTIYSSSTSVVFGETSCISVGSKAICVSDDSDFGGLYACVEQKDKTWKCEKVKASANVPPALTDALDDAIGPAGPLQEGRVLEKLESNATFAEGLGPNFGGVLEIPETNDTFSESNSSSNTSSNTLAQLQSETENDSAENNRDEADESEESGDSNE